MGIFCLTAQSIGFSVFAMEHRDVSLFRPAQESRNARLHRFLRRGGVEQHLDVAFLETVELDQGLAQVLDVVDAPSEVGAGHLRLVDTD